MTLYQPFLEHAIATLRSRLDLAPYPIPPGFEFKATTTGKGQRQTTVSTTSYAFQTKKLRQIRAAHVQGGDALQVLNFVIFPDLHHDLPVFGGDLVTLPGGHLIAIDLQPLAHDADDQAKYTEPMTATFKHFQALLPWGGDLPDEAKPFFSPILLWSRPSQTKEIETNVFDAFKAYLEQYLDLVEQAAPVTDPDRLAKIRATHLRYSRYRAVKDPARGMFQRLYGKTWTEAYIHGFLFDLEPKMASEEFAIA
jgi:phycoerythrobilin:ferredoxin oxidoreductase